MGAGAGAGSVAAVGCGSGAAAGGASRGPGTGFFDCSVSGSCVVVVSGTLDSGVLENTVGLSLCPGEVGRTVMARLEVLVAGGLIGRAYWYTT